MKYIITILSLCVMASTVNAEPVKLEKPVVCDVTAKLLSAIQHEYKERPIWVGKGEEGSNYSLLTNKETGSWTVIQFNKTLACVLGSGDANSLIKEQ